MDLLLWLGLGVLGGVGALCRFLFDGAVSARFAGGFPAGTLAVNATGALVLGILVSSAIGDDGLRVVGVGLLGSFTTFSTWMLESERAAEDGKTRTAVANVAISLAVGVALAWAGMQIGEAL